MSDKPKPSKSRSSKKGSQHADIIDRLDYTGVGANGASVVPHMCRGWPTRLCPTIAGNVLTNML